MGSGTWLGSSMRAWVHLPSLWCKCHVCGFQGRWLECTDFHPISAASFLQVYQSMFFHGDPQLSCPAEVIRRGPALTGHLTRNCALAFTLATSTLPPNTLHLPLVHLKYVWGFHTWGEECLKDNLCYVSWVGLGFALQLSQASGSWGSSDSSQTSNPPAFAYQLMGWQSVSSSCLYWSLKHSLKEPLPSRSFMALLFTAICSYHQRTALARAIHAPFCSGCWGHL